MMQWCLTGGLLVLLLTNNLCAVVEKTDEPPNPDVTTTNVENDEGNSTVKVEIENIIEDVEETNEMDSATSRKHKRCPSEFTLGTPMKPLYKEIPGPRSGFTLEQNNVKNTQTSACTKCLNRNHCESVDACNRCDFWCKPLKDSEGNMNLNRDNSKYHSDIKIPNTYENMNEKIDDTIVSISNRNGNMEEPNNAYVIATLKSGEVKDIICRLVGIQNIKDIDRVIISVITHSQQPPVLNNINEIANPSLPAKNFRNVISDEILPRYPIDDEGTMVHQIVNPDIIEGPPMTGNSRTNNMGQETESNLSGPEVNVIQQNWPDENGARIGSPLNTQVQRIISPSDKYLPEFNQNIDQLPTDKTIFVVGETQTSLTNTSSRPMLALPRVIDKLRKNWTVRKSKGVLNDETGGRLPTRLVGKIAQSKSLNETVGVSNSNDFKENENRDRNIISLSNRANENISKETTKSGNAELDQWKKSREKLHDEIITPQSIKIDNNENKKYLSGRNPVSKIQNIIENIKKRREEKMADKKVPTDPANISLNNPNESDQGKDLIVSLPVHENKRNMYDTKDNANVLNLEKPTISGTKNNGVIPNKGFIENRNTDDNNVMSNRQEDLIISQSTAGKLNEPVQIDSNEDLSATKVNLGIPNKNKSENGGGIFAPSIGKPENNDQGNILKEEQKPNYLDHHKDVISNIMDKTKKISQWVPPIPTKKDFDILKNRLGKIQELSKKIQKKAQTRKSLDQQIKSTKQLYPEIRADKLNNVPKYDNTDINQMNNKEIIGSQPLENSREIIQPTFSRLNVPPGTINLQQTGPLSKEKYVGVSNTPVNINNDLNSKENNELNSPNDIEVSARNPKDIYFIGNGLKLPLQMARTENGEIHLSVDVDKMCSCKNISCPANHTLEETVSTILKKEAELKDQLQPIFNPISNNYFENNTLGIAAPLLKNRNSFKSNLAEKNTFLETKNNIMNTLSDSLGIQSENADIFRRSLRNHNSRNAIVAETNTAPVTESSNYIQGFLHKIRSAMPKNKENNIGISNYMTTSQSEPTGTGSYKNNEYDDRLWSKSKPFIFNKLNKQEKKIR